MQAITNRCHLRIEILRSRCTDRGRELVRRNTRSRHTQIFYTRPRLAHRASRQSPGMLHYQAGRPAKCEVAHISLPSVRSGEKSICWSVRGTTSSTLVRNKAGSRWSSVLKPPRGRQRDCWQADQRLVVLPDRSGVSAPCVEIIAPAFPDCTLDFCCSRAPLLRGAVASGVGIR
jgi:hypothetical protein